MNLEQLAVAREAFGVRTACRRFRSSQATDNGSKLNSAPNASRVFGCG
jgi:hypothetical protein